VRGFVHAAEIFVDQIGSIDPRWLLLAIGCHLLKTACRTRSWLNILLAAYPDAGLRWRGVYGAYVAGVGVNAILPARGGDVLRLFLVKREIQGATYPTLAATLVVETLFDFVVATALLGWAITLGVLPGLDMLPRFPAFDWAWMWRHPAETITIAAALGLLLAFAGARAGRHAVALKQRLAQGFAILRRPGLYVQGVLPWQMADWLFRLATIYCFLRAFDVVPSIHNALLVQVTQSISTVLPFTPGGIGTEQALLVYVFAGQAPISTLLGFSIGMKLVLVVVNVAVGFAAIALILRTLRWRRVVSAEAELPVLTPGPQRLLEPESE
jgi:uncharacterized membrane protein YbhN (UPF0104 family)